MVYYNDHTRIDVDGTSYAICKTTGGTPGGGSGGGGTATGKCSLFDIYLKFPWTTAAKIQIGFFFRAPRALSPLRGCVRNFLSSGTTSVNLHTAPWNLLFRFLDVLASPEKNH